MSSEARQYAARNRQGSDWFGHNSDPVPLKQGSGSPSVSEMNTSPVHAKNENATAFAVAESSPSPSKPARPLSDSNEWYKCDTKSGVTTSHVTDTPQSGTAASWFSHEHADTGADVAHTRGSSKELSLNAARMRGESEQWFSHDQTSKTSSPLHSQKGRVERSTSNEMHGIFHHAAAN